MESRVIIRVRKHYRLTETAMYTAFRVHIRLLFGCSRTLSTHMDMKTDKIRKMKISAGDRSCDHEVIGMKMHQLKVSGLNSIHLICDSYFNI